MRNMQELGIYYPTPGDAAYLFKEVILRTMAAGLPMAVLELSEAETGILQLHNPTYSDVLFASFVQYFTLFQ
jgi:hypothetical protein